MTSILILTNSDSILTSSDQHPECDFYSYAHVRTPSLIYPTNLSRSIVWTDQKDFYQKKNSLRIDGDKHRDESTPG